MAKPEDLARLRKSVEEWNRWRKANPDGRPDLREADLTNANLVGANLCNADLSRAHLSSENLSQADLSNATLCHASLRSVLLFDANLTGANLDGANLSFADLRGSDLTGAYLPGAGLTGADLSTAYLPWPPGEDPVRTDLTDANLSGADLRYANLTGAILNSADLRNAFLIGANFNKAGLRASKFEGAVVGSTVFAECDLSEAQGLDLVRHEGPSTIGIDTIFLSKEKIPEIFLRGAGVPDNFVRYMHSLVGHAFEFYSCFISYSTKDQDFAVLLHADLQANGVRCWFAPHDMESGKKLHEQIDQAIRLHERLLLILSPDSINSEWVKTEIKKARNREIKEKRRVLFPIGLISFEDLKNWEYPDPDTGKDIALEIREYYIPDFTNWKTNQDLYRKEFKKLLKSLQSAGTAPAGQSKTSL